MAKRLITFTLILTTLLLSLSSCRMQEIGGKGEEARDYALFDKNGNILCDYYVSLVLLNERRIEPGHGYSYVVHRYRNIEGVSGWKDLIYTDKAYQTEGIVNHVIAMYSSYSEYSGYFESPTYLLAQSRNELSVMIDRYFWVKERSQTMLPNCKRKQLPKSTTEGSFLMDTTKNS